MLLFWDPKTVAKKKSKTILLIVVCCFPLVCPGNIVGEEEVGIDILLHGIGKASRLTHSCLRLDFHSMNLTRNFDAGSDSNLF